MKLFRPIACEQSPLFLRKYGAEPHQNLPNGDFSIRLNDSPDLAKQTAREELDFMRRQLGAESLATGQTTFEEAPDAQYQLQSPEVAGKFVTTQELYQLDEVVKADVRQKFTAQNLPIPDGYQPRPAPVFKPQPATPDMINVGDYFEEYLPSLQHNNFTGNDTQVAALTPTNIAVPLPVQAAPVQTPNTLPPHLQPVPGQSYEDVGPIENYQPQAAATTTAQKPAATATTAGTTPSAATMAPIQGEIPAVNIETAKNVDSIGRALIAKAQAEGKSLQEVFENAGLAGTTFYVDLENPGSKLRVRTTPGGSIVGNLGEGTPLKATGAFKIINNHPWFQVKTPDGKEGWASAFYLNKERPAGAPASAAANKPKTSVDTPLTGSEKAEAEKAYGEKLEALKTNAADLVKKAKTLKDIIETTGQAFEDDTGADVTAEIIIALENIALEGSDTLEDLEAALVEHASNPKTDLSILTEIEATLQNYVEYLKKVEDELPETMSILPGDPLKDIQSKGVAVDRWINVYHEDLPDELIKAIDNLGKEFSHLGSNTKERWTFIENVLDDAGRTDILTKADIKELAKGTELDDLTGDKKEAMEAFIVAIGKLRNETLDQHLDDRASRMDDQTWTGAAVAGLFGGLKLSELEERKGLLNGIVNTTVAGVKGVENGFFGLTKFLTGVDLQPGKDLRKSSTLNWPPGPGITQFLGIYADGEWFNGKDSGIAQAASHIKKRGLAQVSADVANNFSAVYREKGFTAALGDTVSMIGSFFGGAGAAGVGAKIGSRIVGFGKANRHGLSRGLNNTGNRALRLSVKPITLTGSLAARAASGTGKGIASIPKAGISRWKARKRASSSSASGGSVGPTAGATPSSTVTAKVPATTGLSPTDKLTLLNAQAKLGKVGSPKATNVTVTPPTVASKVAAPASTTSTPPSRISVKATPSSTATPLAPSTSTATKLASLSAKASAKPAKTSTTSTASSTPATTTSTSPTTGTTAPASAPGTVTKSVTPTAVGAKITPSAGLTATASSTPTSSAASLASLKAKASPSASSASSTTASTSPSSTTSSSASSTTSGSSKAGTSPAAPASSGSTPKNPKKPKTKPAPVPTTAPAKINRNLTEANSEFFTDKGGFRIDNINADDVMKITTPKNIVHDGSVRGLLDFDSAKVGTPVTHRGVSYPADGKWYEIVINQKTGKTAKIRRDPVDVGVEIAQS